jgi:succinate dehydrogenase flavin-adding protein (antitoxin of CptAB toxin-antitoxin module)
MIDIAAALDKMTEEEKATFNAILEAQAHDIQETTTPQYTIPEIKATLLGLIAKGLLEVYYQEGEGAGLRLKEG